MGALDFELSRISKFLIDRDQDSAETALARRQSFAVTLLCGDNVAGSYGLQLAVLTAASIAIRCFPGVVKAAVSQKLANAPLLLWPSLQLTFGGALIDLLGPEALVGTRGDVHPGHGLLFGDLPARKNALRVTFDGWVAKVGPAVGTPPLPEREYCSLAGILAAALALSELFLAFAGISIEATRRTVGLSLWRPDLDIADPNALGPMVEYLPSELWVLGLGHLGNAYLWALGTLPYQDSRAAEFFLYDFDRVIRENVETGIIFTTEDVRCLKTRASSSWLEKRGF